MKTIKNLIQSLFNTLMNLSEQHKDILFPGYTHMQVAMSSSFVLWFGAYAESLVDDLIVINAAIKVADQNPLGCAAGYGSSFPIDRTLTIEIIGFSTMKYNVVAAQISRGKLEKTTSFALSSIAATLSKLSADICLYMSQNFNFVGFPKELTTGSSIMPHKQNSDVFEIMRATSNKIQNLPSEIVAITNNLTSGYHRDLQLLKESFMEGIQKTKDNLEVCDFMLQNIQVKSENLKSSIYDYLFSIEEVNKLVMQGFPFREAYQILGQAIENEDYHPDKKLSHSHEGSIGNLCNDKIKEKFIGEFI